jgi:hypothetical protein
MRVLGKLLFLAALTNRFVTRFVPRQASPFERDVRFANPPVAL